MSVEIRLATPKDAETLARLKLETFRQTFVTGGFKIPYPADDLAAFEAETYSAEAVRTELTDPQRTSWIAWRDHVALGYAHIGPCKLPHPEVTDALGELYQIYVRDEAQGLGLGRDLLRLAIDQLEAAYPGPIWLGVWSGNHRAQAIYAKLGFQNVGGYEFPVGTWRDQEYIFRRD